MMKQESLIEKLKNEILEAGPGRLYCARDFAHYNNSSAVSRILSCFATSGLLTRITRGIYYYPMTTRYGDTMPTPFEVASYIALKNNCKILPTADAALNYLGLCEQVPMNTIVLTTGRSRTVMYGDRPIKFTHATPDNFVYNNYLISLIALGLKEKGEGNLTPYEINRIKGIINKLNMEADLTDDLALMPSWIKEIITDNF